MMLRGRCDGLVGPLLEWVEGQELTTEILEAAQRLGGHRQATPALGGPVQDRPDQRQAALFTGQAADHLDAAAGLPEGPLDQVGVADALAVLSREQQVDRSEEHTSELQS